MKSPGERRLYYLQILVVLAFVVLEAMVLVRGAA